MHSPRVVCLLLTVNVLVPGVVLGQGARRQTIDTPVSATVDQALRDADTLPSRPRVIVRYRAGKEQQVRQRLAARQARTLRGHDSISGLSAELPAAAVYQLASDPDVVGVSIDAVVSVQRANELQSQQDARRAQSRQRRQPVPARPRPTPPKAPIVPLPVAPAPGTQPLRSTLGIQGFESGAGVGIAIIDSGIDPNRDLRTQITAFYDFTRGGVAAIPSDEYGHGTHIAGLMAGNGTLSSNAHVGVAPGVRLIGLKVLDKEGQGYTSDVIAAIEFAIANRMQLGIDIINLSLGHPVFEPAASDPLVQAVERASAAGIVVVTSAGNNGYNRARGTVGYGGINSPGNAPSAITVGSLRTRNTVSRLDDEISLYSSRGPTWYDGLVKPDILAPGQALVAVGNLSGRLYQDLRLRDAQAPYMRMSGTSMAAGVAAGVVALMIEAHRGDQPGAAPLTPNIIKAILQYSAIPVPDEDPTTPSVLEQGAGGINAAGAMALTRAIDPSMPSGSAWLEHGITPVSLIGGAYLTWAQHIVWGEHIVWGDTIARNHIAWSSHIVWGDTEHIVWGDSFLRSADVVRESFTAWSQHIVWGDAARVWSDGEDAHIVWGDLAFEHIVWGDHDDEHIVWGD